MDATFTKYDAQATGTLLGEASALSWLGEASALGGVPAAALVEVDTHHLVETRVEQGSLSPETAYELGAALAHTHAAGAPWWGCPPAGWKGAYIIQDSQTPCIASDHSQARAGWGSFYARVRCASYLDQIEQHGLIAAEEKDLIEQLFIRLEEGVFNASQPALVEERIRAEAASGPVCDARGPACCARIHGDLWAGNLLVDANPHNPAHAVLIDPMAQGGHAETDLAMLALFGYPYIDSLFGGYNDASQLCDGWQERQALHQLAPLLHHWLLFGRSYATQALQVARRYL